MLENAFKSLLRALEANNYLRFTIILILCALFFGAYKLGNWQERAFDSVEKSAAEKELMRREFQKREDSLRNDYFLKLDKVETAFERYKDNDRRKDSLRIAELEEKDREEKRVVRSFRAEAVKTEKISKTLDNTGKNLAQ